MQTQSNYVSKARQALHSSGGRMTSQRRLILEVLVNSENHPTAEEIHAQVNKLQPSIHLSTVYRTLRWLEGNGLVNSRMFDDERGLERFDPIAVGEKGNHFHFRCERCGKIIEFKNPEMEKLKIAFESQNLCQVHTIDVIFYGLCSECDLD